MRLSDFRFDLPQDRIAQAPAEPRDAARLLVVRRGRGETRDAAFVDLPDLLSPGDLLVVNDTRVIPARLRGHKQSGGKAEVLLVKREAPTRWEALVRSSKRSLPGTRIEIGPAATVRIIESRGQGLYLLEFETDRPIEEVLDAVGEIPLPPYIRRDRPDPLDRLRYQTLFADPAKGGSAAAPTAGLHFTPRVLEALRHRGIEWASVTLHVGLGTFLPVRSDEVSQHRMHREWFHVPSETAAAVNQALARGSRIIAVGTTATRTLEHCGKSGTLEAGSGWTDLFVLPGHRFQVVGGLLTNFHLPESTLLMLVCAFGGQEAVLEAYRRAVEAGYRFYSYGDAMLLL